MSRDHLIPKGLIGWDFMEALHEWVHTKNTEIVDRHWRLTGSRDTRYITCRLSWQERRLEEWKFVDRTAHSPEEAVAEALEVFANWEQKNSSAKEKE